MTADRSNDVAIVRLAPLIAGIATATALLFIAYRHGPALAPDSIDYLSTGLNISQGRGVTTYDGGPLTPFPPILSVLIALGHLFGVAGTQTAAVVNLMAMIITVGGVFLLLRRRANSRAVIWIGTMVAAATPALFSAARFLSTDPLFVAFVVIWLCLADQIVSAKRSDLIAVSSLGLVGAVSFMIRYAGVTLIASGLIVLLAILLPQRASLSRSVYGKVAAYLFISCSAPALWLVRNHLADGTWMGPRARANVSPIEILRRIVSTFGSWLVPVPPGYLTFGVAIVAIVAFAIFRKIVPPVPRERSAWGRMAFDPPVVFSAVYMPYLVLAAWSTAFDPIGVRLLSPVFVPALIVVLQWVDRNLTRLPKPSRFWYAVPVVALLLIVGNASVSAAKAFKMAEEGNGFGLVEFREDSFSQLVKGLDDDVVIVSNDGRAVWSLRRAGEAYDIPRPEWYATAEAYQSALLDMTELISCSDAAVYLVLWSDQPSAGLEESVVADALSWTTVSDDSQGVLAVISLVQSSHVCDGEEDASY